MTGRGTLDQAARGKRAGRPDHIHRRAYKPSRVPNGVRRVPGGEGQVLVPRLSCETRETDQPVASANSASSTPSATASWTLARSSRTALSAAALVRSRFFWAATTAAIRAFLLTDLIVGQAITEILDPLDPQIPGGLESAHAHG